MLNVVLLIIVSVTLLLLLLNCCEFVLLLKEEIQNYFGYSTVYLSIRIVSVSVSLSM